MSTLLIQSKLCVPAPHSYTVARGRLVAELARVFEPAIKLALLAAPPGFGKTTLLSTWAAQCSHPVAWLTLDEFDDDLVHFWDYVIAALRQVQPDIGEASLSLLHEPVRRPMPIILGQLLNDLHMLPHPVCLVLDDYHTVQREEIHHGLTFLLDHLPSQLRLIIATRIDPPLPLARLRVRGQLVELRAGDLRFRAAEGAELLAHLSGTAVGEDAVAALEARTEGWAAGIQLAALAVRGRADPARLLAEFAGDHRHLLDYLIDEVLARQPHTVQRFLLETSILGRLCAPLCAAVTGNTTARALLDTLERDNLFVVALDDRRQWYRYHQLFGGFLRHQLEQEDADHVQELHRRASAWFAQQGYLVESVHHALAAADHDLAGRLVEGAAEMLLWRRPELHTLLGWLDALPEALIAARPRLALYHAWTRYLSNDMAGAEQRVMLAIQACAAKGDDPLTDGMLAAVRSSLLAIRQSFEAAAPLAREALARLPGGAISWRCMAAINLGVAEAAIGDSGQAIALLSHAMELSQEIGSVFAMTSAFWHLAAYQLAQMQLDAALATCDLLARLIREPDLVHFPAVGYLALLAGEVALERNELGVARSQLLSAVDRINAEGFPMALLRCQLALARVAELEGDPAESAAWVARAEALVHEHHLQTRSSPLALYRVRKALQSGDLGVVEQWATDLRLSLDGPVGYHRESHVLLVARYLLAQAKTEEALALLTRLEAQAEAGGRHGTTARVWLLMAQTLAALGRESEAVETLARGLALTAHQGAIRVVVDDAGALAPLLEQVVTAHQTGTLPPDCAIAPAYLQRLLELTAQPTADLRRRSDAVTQPLVEPLSERELEVLRLLADDLTSTAIADRLIIAVETARRHIKNIYGKLGVHSRLEALRRGHELGYL